MGEEASGFSRILLDVVLMVEQETEKRGGLSDALQMVHEHFRFGSAFIYEYDPRMQFVLQEHSVVNGRDDLPTQFTLTDHLTDSQLSSIVKEPVCYTGDTSELPDLQLALAELFMAQSFFVMFIVGGEGDIIGCVGMADKRRHPRLSESDLYEARTLLALIVNAARLRIYKQNLEYARATLENIMDHTGFDIYVNDYDTHEMLYANGSMAQPYGGWENMRGKTCHEALYEGQKHECVYCPKHNLVDETGNPNKIYSWDYQRPFDGRWFRVISSAFHWTDGRLAQVISSADIDEAKRNEMLIERMAFYDMLCDIPNRRKFETDLEDHLTKLDEYEKGIAILFLDLDDFKQVNDTYGHNTGDALLKHVADMFQSNPLTAGCCYRYAGDEFIFVFPDMTQDEAQFRAGEIESILGKPFEIDGHRFVCSGSVGFAHCPEDGTDFWTILDRADSSMYENKEVRKGA